MTEIKPVGVSFWVWANQILLKPHVKSEDLLILGRSLEQSEDYDQRGYDKSENTNLQKTPLHHDL